MIETTAGGGSTVGGQMLFTGTSPMSSGSNHGDQVTCFCKMVTAPPWGKPDPADDVARFCPPTAMRNISTGDAWTQIGSPQNVIASDGSYISVTYWLIEGNYDGANEFDFDNAGWTVNGSFSQTFMYYWGINTTEPARDIQTPYTIDSGDRSETLFSASVQTIYPYSWVVHAVYSEDGFTAESPLATMGGANMYGYFNQSPSTETDTIIASAGTGAFTLKTFELRYKHVFGPRLEMRMDGGHDSTTFTDETGRHSTITPVGNAKQDAVTYKCGISSLTLNSASAGYITIPHTTDFNLLEGEYDRWTVQCWVKLNGHASRDYFVGQPDGGWVFYHDHGIGLTGVFPGHSNNLVGGEITDTDWHHIAYCQVENQQGIYLDGQQVSYQQTVAGRGITTIDLHIGGQPIAFQSYKMDGWIDELKIDQDNVFDADPVPALTDTITVPPCPGAYDLIDPTESCGYVGTAYRDVPNLSHLEGQTVAILANGEVLDRQVVVDGAVDLGDSYNVAHVGLPFVSDIETLAIEVPWQEGTVQARKVKVGNVLYRLENSRGGWIGPNSDDLYEAFTRDAINQCSGQNIGTIELFTGDIRQPLGAQFGQGGNIFYRQVDPLPITIGAIIPEVSVGGQAR